MATFREIDMSIHSLLDSQPIEKAKTTAEEILEKYKQSEAEEAESKGGSDDIYSGCLNWVHTNRLWYRN